jgi:peptide/nickel transport system substrate-binding protein
MYSSKLWRTAASAAGMALALGAGSAAAESVLRVAPHADLRNIDPIWTTAYITRNHGYMVYDTLFAKDANLQTQPQMVDTYSVSDDGMKYTFTLRDGMKWHDGTPVTAADCVASIQRWGKRDTMGQKLMEFVASLEAVDETTFTLTLKEKYGLVLDSLGKISSNVPFMMPKAMAETDPFEQVPEIIGSGPFKFMKDQWVPGSKVVYVKNPDYKPRAEPASAAAGGKVVKVDRVEWLYIPDAQTTLNALAAGEVDFWETPAPDMMAQLKASDGVKVEIIDPLGTQGWLRPNHKYPPFDNPKARQALAWMVNQEDYMRVVVGDPELYKICGSFFICGTPYGSEAGGEAAVKQDFEKAKALLKEAGYNGEKIILMQPTDVPLLNNASTVTAQLLRQIGMNVEVQAMDWSTLTSRRAVQDPPGQGGWNIFHTYSTGADVSHPISNSAVAATCDSKSWFGWPCDEKIEELRDQFAREPDPAKQKAIALELQERASEVVPYVSYGQWYQPVAYSTKLTGVLNSPVPLFWNIEKTD